MDKIIIKGLKTKCIIGDYEWERKHPQKIILDLELECDCRTTAQQDALGSGSVDYSRVTQEVLGLVESSSCRLIETLAERVAELCLRRFPIQAITVRLAKPGAIQTAEMVLIEIYRKTCHPERSEVSPSGFFACGSE